MKIVLTGGGTGGHIYPALSLWSYLKTQYPDAEVLYIGSERGMERNIVGRHQLPFEAVSAAGLKRQISWTAFKTVVKTFRGYLQAKRILKRWRPDIVVGTGGYVTLPVIFAANRLHLPTVIWEGNARPGLTNQLCAQKSDAIALCFEDSKKWLPKGKHMVLTGNPRASEVLAVSKPDMQAAQEKYHVRQGQRLIILFMGSSGSSTVNRVVQALLPRFVKRADWRFMFITGEKNYAELSASAESLPEHVSIHPFVYDLADLLPRADVLITRAGSATLGEICSLGVASILIPSPYVTANHQEENAKRLAERDAAQMIREAELNAELLWTHLVELLDGGGAMSMRANALTMATPNAVELLYQLVMETCRMQRV